MIVIKTGMASEYRVARIYAPPGSVVLTGIQTIDTLEKSVPSGCKGIISFGLCGGLSPSAQIGQAFIYDAVVYPNSGKEVTAICDVDWRRRLFASTKYYERKCWSTGQFNTANTIPERSQLYAQTGCEVIDDESFAVAMFAQKHNVPFVGLRIVSDGAEDNLPPAVVDAINADGSVNAWDVTKSIVTDPLQIPSLVKTMLEFEKSVAELRTAAIQAGPDWCSP